MTQELNYPKIRSIELPAELLEKLTAASNLIKSTSSTIKVISHYDADGLSAGGILTAILVRLGKKFHTTLVHSIGPESTIFSELQETKFDVKIFTDMGTGQLESIEGLDGWSIILDHHKLSSDTTANNVIHINAHQFGYDGSVEVAAASLAFLLSISITPKNWDLIYLALAGAIGDKQNKNGFSGVNKIILKTALEHGLITEKVEFKPRGKTILEALERSTDPYFVGLSNNKSAVNKLLTSLQISPDAAPNDIDPDSMQRLVSYLVVKLLEQDITPDDAEGVVTNRYYTKQFETDLESLSHQINACGRMNRMGIGVAAGLGDQWALDQSEQLRREHKETIKSGLKKLETDGLTELENIQYFHESVPEFAGTFAGIGMMYFFNQRKPVIALTKTEENIKISGRGTRRLIGNGLDLANVLATVASELGGTGGGHNIAAGATIPLETEKKFLDKVNRMVGEQLQADKND